ncbi:YybH family protein [Actinokineospora sp.]|uniref:YybH family protein n=1 Tax=Actinokineospora sp. TaxID=1872133 RepID=UPI004037F7ED
MRAHSETTTASEIGDEPFARELVAAQYAMNQQFLDRDLEVFLANYHPDATFILFDGSIYPTPASIREYYTGLFADRRWTATFTVAKLTISGQHSAVVIEDATMAMAALDYHLHYLGGLTWVREDGRWQVLLDHLTTISESTGRVRRRRPAVTPAPGESAGSAT